MKRTALMMLLALGLVCLASGMASARGGYVRSSGTYVQPHSRSTADRNPYNNWSYPRNVSPSYGPVFVNGYYRSNGTYVSPHWRRR